MKNEVSNPWDSETSGRDTASTSCLPSIEEDRIPRSAYRSGLGLLALAAVDNRAVPEHRDLILGHCWDVAGLGASTDRSFSVLYFGRCGRLFSPWFGIECPASVFQLRMATSSFIERRNGKQIFLENTFRNHDWFGIADDRDQVVSI